MDELIIQRFKNRVSGMLERIINGQPGRGPILAGTYMHPDLIEISRYSISNSGSMWRPLLLRSTAVGRYGVSEKIVIPYAAILEGNHINTLNLDDLPCMDNQNMRRGKKTPHLIFTGDQGASKDSGTANIILSVYTSQGLLNKAVDYGPATKEQNNKISDELSATRINLGNGQYIDLNKTQELKSLEEFVELFRLKTGPLFGAAMAIGGILGKEEEEKISLLREAGYNMGIVYQFFDDFLDWGGNEKRAGKPLGFDKKKKNFLDVTTPKIAYNLLIRHKKLANGLLKQVDGDFSQAAEVFNEIENNFIYCMKPNKLAELKTA